MKNLVFILSESLEHFLTICVFNINGIIDLGGRYDKVCYEAKFTR